jgi:hypothetical protein
VSMFTRLLESKSDDYLRYRIGLDQWWEGVRQAHDALIAENERLTRELAEARAQLKPEEAT